MDFDSKLYALMSVADDQQKLATQFIDLQKEELKLLKEERASINATHEQVLKKLEDKLGARIHFGWLLSTISACIFCALIIVGSTFLYLGSITSELTETQNALSELSGLNAEILTCEKDDKSYPCIRVMRTWGGYGKNSDLYIIDPK